VTDPTHDAPPEPPPWRLTLEHGDQLELHPPAEAQDGSSEPEIVLTLRPYRAAELGVVLDRYNRMAGIFGRWSLDRCLPALHQHDRRGAHQNGRKHRRYPGGQPRPAHQGFWLY
jgi:hypothetical protein